MPSYAYTAVDKTTNKEVKAIIQAESIEQAKNLLRNNALLVLSLSKSNDNQAETKQSWRLFSRRLSTQKLMLFTRQLATLLSSGMEIDNALRLIATQANSKEIAQVATHTRSNLSEGMTLAQSLQRSGTPFSKDYLATIAAGEETGHMIEVMERLADEVEHNAKTMQGLLSAFIYPAVLLVVALAITLYLMVAVVPIITDMFSSMNKNLPTITEVIISISNFLIDYGAYLAIVILMLVLIFAHQYKRSNELRIIVHKRLFALLFFGDLFLGAQIARWSRSFGMLLASGVPTLQAFHISLQTVTNSYLYTRLEEVGNKVREGQALHQALQAENIIPSFVVHMCSSGEAAGNLDAIMLKVSEYYVQSVRMTTETAVKLIEPAIILLMGGMVMLIVLGVLLPVFELNSFA